MHGLILIKSIRDTAAAADETGAVTNRLLETYMRP
jgi:hypothetical protein